MKKENFIKILSEMTPQEINALIEQKGKKPKKIQIMFRID